MNREEKIKLGIVLAQSFASKNSRGSPEIESELLSRLYEALMRRIDTRIEEPERYFKVTFASQCKEYFRTLNNEQIKDNAFRADAVTKMGYNGGIEKVLLSEFYSSGEFTSDEKMFVSMRLEGFSDTQIKEHFDISRNRFKAVEFRLERKLRDFII